MIENQKHWDFIDNLIKTWGLRFIGRVPETIIKDDIDNLNFNERGLAFECLVEHILEYNANVSLVELNDAISILEAWKRIDDNWPHINTLLENLRKLVVDSEMPNTKDL